ncbi:DUF1453 family protein [Novosphingobium sp. ZN18A2]|uniref:hypothetical protein n=1 Tax=Novosphingobium sp. ZN18A2 TaxID=3079861 RepID=UPI0030D14019
MPQQGAASHGLIGFLIPVMVIAIVFAIRFRRMGKTRPLRLERLWILPAIYGAFMATMLITMPPQGAGWLWIAMALAAGAVAGWLRGKTMHISVDPVTHALDHAQSPAALGLLLVLVVIRTGSKMYLESGGPMSHAATMLLTDVLIAFAMGMFTLQRIEMFMRARRLLAAARSGGAPRKTPAVTGGGS